jgi:hypothetical protein
LSLAHSGPFDPRIAGIEFTLPPISINGKKCMEMISSEQLGPQPGWHAIEACFLLGGDPLSAADGHGGWNAPSRITGYDLSYFLNFEPVATAGYSIFIYHIALEDANRVRRKMGLPEIEEIHKQRRRE